MKNFLLIITILLSLNINAQQPSIYLSGTILDSETNVPLEYATISVFKQNDSIAKYGGLADLDGKFNFEIEKIIRIKIEYISFKIKYLKKITVFKFRFSPS